MGRGRFPFGVFCQKQSNDDMQHLRLLLASAVLCIGLYGPTHAQGTAASSRDSLKTEDDSSRPDFRLLRQNERWDALAGEETGWAALKHAPQFPTGAT